jgi:hypothetical protein
MNFPEKILKWFNHSIFHNGLLGLASVGYIIQSWIYSQNQKSFLDEGFYLTKGYLFATGRLTPFQAYGTWTNKMPLSFLIPGYIQRVFGPGLETGRLYAFILSVLILLVAIILGHRLGGKWGGTATALLLTLNPAPLKIYNMVLSEVLIVLLLVLSLLLILGKERPIWQILIGAFIAGMIPVTRINMLPVLPLLVLYIFWEHGGKIGVYGLLVSLVPFLGIHLLYWPEILQLWAPWVPDGLVPLIDNWSFNVEGITRLPRSQRNLLDRYVAVIEGIRHHFPAMLGVFASLIFWPKKWVSDQQKRSSILLAALFLVLLALHFYASITLNYNIFAFTVYLTFFDILGIFLLVTTVPNWNLDVKLIKRIIVCLLLVLIILGVAYTVSEIGTPYGLTIREILSRRAFTFEGGKITRASWKWWEVFKGRLGWEYTTTVRILAGTIFLGSISILTLGFSLLLFIKDKTNKGPYVSYVLIVFLSLGIILSPTGFLGGSRKNYDCQLGVIETYDRAVGEISSYIDAGDEIFWIGSDTEVVLIGLIEEQDISIYPQLLNTRYSFRFGGDPDQLARRGFWNEDLAQDWIDGSDTLLFEEQSFTGWFDPIMPYINLDDFEMVGATSPTGCSPDERILIYQRVQ